MEEMIIRKNEDVDAGFNRCVDLLLNYKELRKSNSYVLDWIKSLASWQLSQIGCDEIKFIVEQNAKNVLAYNNDGTIFISSGSLKAKSLKDFVKLTDTILHEFSHIKTDKQNNEIRKNEHGNANGHYKPKFSYYGVLQLLKKFVDVDIAGDLTLAYYSQNENEQTANAEAKDGIFKLISFAKTVKDYAWLDKMLKIENELFDKTNKRISQHNHKLKIYSQDLKTSLTKFQLSYAKNPQGEENNEKDRILYFIARTINPCSEADQILFGHYLANKDVENCLMLINLPDFKHSTSNLRDLIALLKENNVSLSKIKNIDLANLNEQKARKKSTIVEDDNTLNLTL